MTYIHVYGKHRIEITRRGEDRVRAECHTCGWACSGAEYRVDQKIDAHVTQADAR